MKDVKFSVSDPRITEILNTISRYSGPVEKADVLDVAGADIIDVILHKLKCIDKENSAYSDFRKTENQLRLEKLMEVFIQYTQFDFSKRAEIGNAGDEIDAIAVCMNVLSEELQSSMACAQARLDNLQESYALIDCILENAPGVVIVVDEQGIIFKCNKKTEEIFNWKVEEVINKNIYQLICAGDTVDQHPFDTDKKTDFKYSEVFLIRKNGERFPAELNLSVVKMKDRLFSIAFISDITERKKAEQTINEINQHLQASLNAMESFTYSVSHDLRAPLRAIHGYLNILNEKYASDLNADARNLIAIVIKNSLKMGLLIDALLTLSKLDRTSIQRKVIDIGEIVNAVLKDILTQLTDNRPRIVVDQLPEALGDHSLITQVYTNLISNAIKYSSKQKNALIEIGAKTEQSRAVYFVKDNGAGFDMRFYDKLFGVFQRLHDQQEFEGNGIGLSLVKQIVNKHGGDIWAESEVNKGATFYFTLSMK